MGTSHDPIRHLEYLRHSLSQPDSPIGFLLSAGCPLAVKMPVGEPPLIPDIKGLTLWICDNLKANEKFRVLLKGLIDNGKDEPNIEDILSFIRALLLVSKGGMVKELSTKDLEDLEKVVCTEITKRVNKTLPDQETPYHNLAKWIDSIDRKNAIEIFTTNYDLLMEQALDDLGVPYFDGFVGSRRTFFDLKAVENDLIPHHWTRLWKMHGSINWYQEKDSIYRSTEVKEEECSLIHPSHLKFDESRKMPYLALLDQLSRFIKRKSSMLIVIGYSFNDFHINDTIINALNANPTAMVLGLMFGTHQFVQEGNQIIDRYPVAYRKAERQHNLNIWSDDKAVIGTNVSLWKTSKSSSDSQIQKFVENVVTEDDKTIVSSNIKLGDFKVLSDFLRSLIGHDKDLSKDKELNNDK